MGKTLRDIIASRAGRNLPEPEARFLGKHKVEKRDAKQGIQGHESDNPATEAPNVSQSKTKANPDVELAEQVSTLTRFSNYKNWLADQQLKESFDHDTFNKYYQRAQAALKELGGYLDEHKGFADKRENEHKGDWEPYIDCFDIKRIASELESMAESCGKSCANKRSDEKVNDKYKKQTVGGI